MKIGKVTGVALVGACLMVSGAMADEIGDASFALPQDVVTAAAAFQQYMISAAHIDAGFSSGVAVHKGLTTAVSYQTAQLEEGMVAYGAIAALQDERFVAGVEAAAGRGDQRGAFAEQLIQDPYAATRIDGAGGAAHRIELALTSKAAPLVSAAKDVKAAAYTVQHQAWSKVFVPDAQRRLAEVKSLSASPAAPTSDDDAAMLRDVGGIDPGSDVAAGFTAIEARSLALAAESVLGHAKGADRERLAPLFTEAESAECLKMAKLNLYQCMAVAGPQYEDIFCMGEHAMKDTGQCVASAAHSSGAADAGYAALAPRQAPAQPTYMALASHRSLRIDPN